MLCLRGFVNTLLNIQIRFMRARAGNPHEDIYFVGLMISLSWSTTKHRSGGGNLRRTMGD